MTKEGLMQLVDEISSHKTISEFLRSRQALSDAIDAALAKARRDALDEVLSLPQIKGNLFAEEAIRALKDMYTNPQNLDTSEKRVHETNKRQHVTDGTKCWCEPVLTYVDPVTGAEVWTHREPQ